MTPAKYRGTLSVLFQLLITVGILVAGLINFGSQYIKPWGWRLPCALAAVPGLFVLMAGILLPESPNSLAERGHYEKAAQVSALLHDLGQKLFCRPALNLMRHALRRHAYGI